ncbi:MAG: Hpt domain-containing protein [Acidobacteria bacterium]|nr:Hpt domain-containing protein [Acidobacteriota bacterium]
MNEFRENFLREFIEPLGDLLQKISIDLSNDVRNDAYRLVHSVKGCSSTFGLKHSANLASELESLLAEGNFDETRKSRIIGNLSALIESLKRPQVEPESGSRRPGADFISKSNLFFNRIRAEQFRQLAEREKTAFFSALENGCDLFRVSAAVKTEAFVDEFRDLRRSLTDDGDIIAVLPGGDAFPEKTAFEMIVSCPEGARPRTGEPELLNIRDVRPKSTQMLSEVRAHVERVSSEAAKLVHLDILANDASLNGRSAPIFEILIHLTSNAVDHGIEKSGRVEVLFLRDAKGYELSVADNGVGIDLEKIAKHAPSNGGTDFDILFEPRFTTVDKPADNSGRGIGLFIVKTEVEKLNGKISVKSRKDLGTRFEITLPE